MASAETCRSTGRPGRREGPPRRLRGGPVTAPGRRKWRKTSGAFFSSRQRSRSSSGPSIVLLLPPLYLSPLCGSVFLCGPWLTNSSLPVARTSVVGLRLLSSLLLFLFLLPPHPPPRSPLRPHGKNELSNHNLRTVETATRSHSATAMLDSCRSKRCSCKAAACCGIIRSEHDGLIMFMHLRARRRPHCQRAWPPAMLSADLGRSGGKR